jgi:hypothetical protein
VVPRKRAGGKAVRKSRQSPQGAPPAPAGHPRRAATRRPPPYIRCIQRSGSVAAWQVDGAYVRGNIDAEFGSAGHHYSFSTIPRTEIWIDAEQESEEQQLLIAQAAIERRLMARGMDYEAAHAVAIAEERRQRLKGT